MRQGDPEWAKVTLPGGATIGRVGCTLTALCILRAHLLHGRMTPREALSLGVQLDAFIDRNGAGPGNLLNVGRLAPAMGLLVSDHIRARERGMEAVERELSAAMTNGCALLWVDHDSALATGDDDGDHYIAGLSVDGADIVCADPATGLECRLSTESLEAVSPYTERPYRLRGVRRVGRLMPPAR